MKKRILILILSVTFFTNCYSQKLVPFSYNGKVGYVNQNLELVLSPQYDYGSNFTDGYAVVVKNNKHHVIDPQGNILYSADALQLRPLGETLFATQGNSSSDYRGLFKVIDIDTKKVIADNLQAVKWERATNPEVIAVAFYDDRDGYYINNKGETLYENIPIIGGYSFNDGVATVMTEDLHFAILDIKGNILDTNFRRLGKFFSESLCPAQTLDGQTGYVDIKGQFVFKIPLVVSDEMGYENTPFENGRAIINFLNDEKYWIVIDNKGNFISDKIRADDCYGFKEGMAVIHKYLSANDEDIFGYVNNQGKIVYDYQFSKADDFYNGYARVILQGKEGIIDRGGNIHFSSDLMKASN